MFFSKAQIVTLLTFASTGLAAAVPTQVTEKSELTARAPNWTVKVYKGTNCGSSPDFTYTGTGSKAKTTFNFSWQVKSVQPLPGPDCTMELAPKNAFPYFVFEGSTQCWAYGHVWDSFTVTCN